MSEPSEHHEQLPRQIEMVDDRMAEILKGKSPLERLEIGFSLWESARTIMAGHLRQIHPEWSAEEIQQEISRRFLNATP